ncbi:molybdenum cofactor guanylyltransferase [Fuerstiella marisgermanici]|uniref:Probable molybdenum cofactor guanylyltransferase n=1 Tax=Fuerstiella marisgermanici TaxID=1891926 RepID=A0A1P8WRK3_9PLAN|nr:molybdenum cofactor guanylyltransferase [Fuerstiella marisgermanici]APZ96690.1 putative molybdenum cofactor guanylyltransferase [Fuerstiella marisgermanici]
MSTRFYDNIEPTDAVPRGKFAAIVLCGGRSQRMGTDKASIRLGDETFLHRTCRVIDDVAAPVIVIANPTQALPTLPAQITVVLDKFPNEGPLGGLLTGLTFLNDQRKLEAAETCGVFLSGCDTPLVNANVIAEMQRRFLTLEPSVDALVVVHESRRQPLHAIYRRSIATQAAASFERGERSLQKLLQGLNVVEVPVSELAALDPDLLFLKNINTPEDLAAARSLL